MLQFEQFGDFKFFTSLANGLQEFVEGFQASAPDQGNGGMTGTISLDNRTCDEYNFKKMCVPRWPYP